MNSFQITFLLRILTLVALAWFVGWIGKRNPELEKSIMDSLGPPSRSWLVRWPFLFSPVTWKRLYGRLRSPPRQPRREPLQLRLMPLVGDPGERTRTDPRD